MINVIGPIFDTSGYSIHTRELANALFKLTKTRMTTNLVDGWEKVVTDEELKMIKEPSTEEVNLIIALPHQWKFFTNNYRNFGYCVWEGDKVPESWINDFLNPDIEYILVPSKHTRQAIENTLMEETENQESFKIEFSDDFDKIMKKVKVINHGVDLDKFHTRHIDVKNISPSLMKEEVTTGVSKIKSDEEVDIGESTQYSFAEFIFLCNKGFRNLEDRGGIQYAIKAYLEEFTPEDKVKLIIKLNMAYPIGDLNKMIEELKPEKVNYPPIEFVAQNIPYKQMFEFYKKGDVFLAPTRAEAFNIPCLEAMACGLPVITTNFGGQTDYVSGKNGWLVSGKLNEVKHELMYEGIKWLTPNIFELRRAMRTAFQQRRLPSFRKKKEESIKIARKLTWSHSAQKIVNLI